MGLCVYIGYSTELPEAMSEMVAGEAHEASCLFPPGFYGCDMLM